MSQIAVVADDAGEPTHPTQANTPDAEPRGALSAATDAIAESKRVSIFASGELAAWARILHRAA